VIKTAERTEDRKIAMRARLTEQPNHHKSLNVYADLGYRAPNHVLIKAHLVSRIAELLAESGMTPIEAESSLGIPHPELSQLLRGQFRGFCERKLMDCLTQLGQEIEIVIQKTRRQGGPGTGSVIFA
jgi:predicted XRE-type DNA-binding protein